MTNSFKFKVKYTPNLPVIGDSPRVTIIGDEMSEFKVDFIDGKSNIVLGRKICLTNETVTFNRQWFTNWIVRIYNQNDELVHEDIFDPTNKIVFIKIDSFAMGDNIAWIPYIDKFRTFHNCTVICSTFWNELFIDEYPKLLFVNPNTKIENVYFQIYVGANLTVNLSYSPVISTNIPLQFVASEILGLPNEELKPKIVIPNRPPINYSEKYVTLSEYGSFESKKWKNSWQEVIDFLNTKGYKTLVISKEPTDLKNIINNTGDASISERIIDIKNAEFHMGVSSGLSWLAWGLGKKVLMVSDSTPHYHEFKSNNIRFGKNINEPINYDYTEITPIENIINYLDKMLT